MLGSPLTAVVESCETVVEQSKHVFIKPEGVSSLSKQIDSKLLDELCDRKHIDTQLHFVDDEETTIQYLFVMDALNFCFWPDPNLEYEHLAMGLKRTMEKDKTALAARNLLEIDGKSVRDLLGWRKPLPNENERARLLREVGHGLLSHFDGKALNLVRRANKSASVLVDLVTMHFPGFRDHAVYKGMQVFLYKRAQIFVGDVWGTYGGQGVGEFNDISCLTMFADYRVPVVLKNLGVLGYSEELERKVESLVELPAGCEEEIEIRAASVVGVERIRTLLREKHGRAPHSVQLDWWLWEKGEAARDTDPPHHRTMTVFY
ncbi:hypothetical protein BSKO_05336 [Bryopsis sp. KO-2023]|nr:hypothetical protein BSKO_05336 [Bryopsis sp. KO-2023]